MTGARHVAEAVGDARRPARLRQLGARLRGRALGRDRAGSSLRRPARPLAPLEDLRRALPAAVRAARPGSRSRSSVSGSCTGRARSSTRARGRRRSWTSSSGLASAGEQLPLDDGGRATIGVVHVEDAARILLESPRSALEVENVVAETTTVAGVAALVARRARRRPSPAGRSRRRSSTGTGSRSTCEAPRHRRGRLPRLADGDGARARPRPRGRWSWRVRSTPGRSRRRGLIEGCAGARVLHFAGVPDPASARADPARAVRENAGTTLNLLEGCLEHGAGLVYPSTVRAAVEPPPDEYALSKRLGEIVCRLHRAPAAVVRFTSVFGPGQVAWTTARRERSPGSPPSALAGEPIVIPGDPRARARLRLRGRRDRRARADRRRRPLERDAHGRQRRRRLRCCARPSSSRAAAGRSAPIETPGGELPPGENESYGADAPLDYFRPAPRRSYSRLCRLAPPPSRSSKPRLSASRSPTASTAATGAGSSCASRGRHVASDEARGGGDRASRRGLGVARLTAESPGRVAERRVRARRPAGRRGARRHRPQRPLRRRDRVARPDHPPVRPALAP